jgi:hypothetical protein
VTRLLVSLLILFAGAGTPRTQLTVVTETGSVSSSLRSSQATLRCGANKVRGTGYLRTRAKQACRLVSKGALQRVERAQRSRRFCSQIYGGPQRAHITGQIGRHRVDLTITRTDGCGTADWYALQTLLGNPEC